MNKLWIGLLVLIFSSTAFAYNHPSFNWKMSENIGNKITLKSTEQLSFFQIQLIKNTFNDVDERFFRYYDVDKITCESGPLDIRVVKDYSILNDKRFFPNLDPDSYANINERIFGRYFRDENILYIIAPRPHIYDWRRDFAHELVHYFLDDCGRIVHGTRIMDNNEEHRFVDKFLDVFKATFP